MLRAPDRLTHWRCTAHCPELSCCSAAAALGIYVLRFVDPNNLSQVLEEGALGCKRSGRDEQNLPGSSGAGICGVPTTGAGPGACCWAGSLKPPRVRREVLVGFLRKVKGGFFRPLCLCPGLLPQHRSTAPKKEEENIRRSAMVPHGYGHQGPGPRASDRARTQTQTPTTPKGLANAGSSSSRHPTPY